MQNCASTKKIEACILYGAGIKWLVTCSKTALVLLKKIKISTSLESRVAVIAVIGFQAKKCSANTSEDDGAEFTTIFNLYYNLVYYLVKIEANKRFNS
jgi:hypothetical protein